ncbi:MAG: VCBS repeat-containing protein [Planctomycetales bacterium]|nr:VCBS repeat-containing protein [Planctomycetales bacterium]
MPDFPIQPGFQVGFGDVQNGLMANLSDLPTGRYSYEIQSGVMQFDGATLSGSTSTTAGDIFHINHSNSPFGAGWALAGWQEIVENSDGSVMLIDGSGGQRLFEPNSDGGYDSPFADFSVLEKLPDGSFRRTLTDQTIYEFNGHNKIASMRDRNGNESRFEYDGQNRLSKFIDPVGLETSFTYSGERVSSIGDPAGRTTQLEYDLAGNLIRITDPDGTFRTFEYDNQHHLVSETDKRGNREETHYDFAGRVFESIRKDGSIMQAAPVQTQGLFPAEQTRSPLTAPVAFVREDAPSAAIADANGNVTTAQLDRFGQIVTQRDGEGPLPSVERSDNNLVTASMNARGQRTEYRYDERGNLIAVADQISNPPQSSPDVFPDRQYYSNLLPVSLEVSDFNNDGLDDIASLAQLPAAVAIFVGVGDGTFAKSQDLPASSGSRFIKSVDLTSDGIPDLVTANQSDATVSTFLGNGDGTFSQFGAFSAGVSPVALTTADFDGDGSADVAVANGGAGGIGGTITFLFGDGLGNLGRRQTVAVGVGPFTLAAEDIDGDGDTDVAVGHLAGVLVNTESVSILENDGSGIFKASKLSGLIGDMLAMGDADNDGDFDIVVVDRTRPVGSGSTLIFLQNDGTGAFSSSNIAIIDDPVGFLLKDVDQDGNLDILVNEDSEGFQQASLRLGRGDGTFESSLTFRSTVPTAARSLAVGDFNDDDATDIVFGLTGLANRTDLADASQFIDVMFGNGNGSFDAIRLISTPFPKDVVVDDFDGDGRKDIVSLLSSSRGNASLSVFLTDENHNPALHNVINIDDNGFTGFVELDSGDTNGDGLRDLILFSRGGLVRLFLGRGDGTFEVGTDFSAPGGQELATHQSVAVSDLNRDGRDDVIVSGNNRALFVSILFGQVDGTLSTRTELQLEKTPSVIAVGDVDGNGGPDLVVSQGIINPLALFLNDGSGNLTRAADIGTGSIFVGANGIELFDANGDGHIDIVIVDSRQGQLSMMRGNGDGTFSTAEVIGPIGVANLPRARLASADFDLDGDVDVVVTDATSINPEQNNAFIFENDGTGNFVSRSFPFSEFSNGPLLTDITSDGIPDLIYPEEDSSTISILQGNRNGTFSRELNYTLPGRAFELTSSDFDGDRIPDVAVTSAVSNAVSVFTQFDGRQFRRKSDIFGPNGTRSFQGIDSSDFDGDGFVDFVALSSTFSTSHVSIFTNKGDTTFGVQSIDVGAAQFSVVSGDFDQDTDVDFATLNPQTSELLLFENDGQGKFRIGSKLAVGAQPRQAFATDVDNDGDVDLLVSNFGDNTVTVLLNHGDATFDSKLIDTGNGPIGLAAEDVNADGLIDLVVANSLADTVTVFTGRGNGNFVAPIEFEAGDEPVDVKIADMDGDGIVDLIITNSGGDSIRSSLEVLLGLGDGTFAARSDYYVGLGPEALAIADFNQDDRPDIATANTRESSLAIRLNQTTTPSTVSEITPRRFSYEPEFNQLTSMTDELGRQTIYEIDPANGNTLSERRIVGEDDRVSDEADDVVTKFSYTQRGLIDTVMDSLGRETDFDYDQFGRLIKTTYAKGTSDEAIERFEYDAAGNLTASIDANGNRTKFEYDALNRLVKTIEADPDGNGPFVSPVTDFSYDPNGNLTSTTDPRRNSTINSYDELNRLIGSTDALGNASTFEYDEAGNAIAFVDELGRATHFEYDDRNRLIATIDALGNVTKSDYDFDNNLTSTTDALGRTTRFVYDARSRLTRNTDALGNSQEFVYDAVNNLVSSTDRNGNKTEFLYDELDRQTVITDALGNSTAFAYDAVGNILTSTDPLLRVTSYTYDARDRLIEQVDPDPDGDAGPLLSPTMQYDHDTYGNVISSTDPLNRTTRFEYDALHRLTSITDAIGNTTRTEYDSNGNLVRTFDRLGRVTSFDYDPLDRVTRQVDPDPDGNGPLLSPVTLIDYDATGNVIQTIDPLNRSTTFEYDDLNRLVTQIDSDADSDGALASPINRFEYDAIGNLLRSIDPLERITQFDYDELNRRTKSTDPRGGEISFTYDASGNLLSLTDPVENTTSWEYDALHRQITETNVLGDSRSFEYDEVGNQVRTIDRNGRRRDFAYDNLNRQTAEEWFDLEGNLVRTLSFGYDAASQLLTANDPDSSYTYAYDKLGRTTSVDNVGTPVSPRVLLEYAYDAVGNRLSVHDSINGLASGLERFQYDGLNRTTRIEQTGANVQDKRVDFSYDAASQMMRIDRFADLIGNQKVVTSTYDYDNLGRLVDLTHANSTEVIAKYEYTFDIASRITEWVLPDGVSTFNYDETDQLTVADHSFQDDENYDYDLNGNRVGNGYATEANNRLIADATYDYTYDAEGNRTRRFERATGIDEIYDWDHRNRLVRVYTLNSNGELIEDARYTYDVFDRRIGRSADLDGTGPAEPEVQRFVYDGVHIALQFDGEQRITNRYVHGPLIDQVLADQGEETFWPLADHQMTVRDTADSTGVVVNHVIYDAYGSIVSESNPGLESTFSYTGREFDEATDLSYYRARFYDTLLGRFASEDPMSFAGNGTNLYRYVLNAPSLWGDPSGNELGYYYGRSGKMYAPFQDVPIEDQHNPPKPFEISPEQASDPEFHKKLRDRARQNIAYQSTVAGYLNPIDQTIAGASDTFTFGITTWMREAIYGDTAVRNHAGDLFDQGRLIGIPASIATGAIVTQLPRAAQATYFGLVGLYNALNALPSVQNIACGDGDFGDYLNVAVGATPIISYGGSRVLNSAPVKNAFNRFRLPKNGAGAPDSAEVDRLLKSMSGGNRKHSIKHLEEFQELDPNITADDLRRLGANIAANKANLKDANAKQKAFQQVVNIGGSNVNVRVILDRKGSLHGIHIRQ